MNLDLCGPYTCAVGQRLADVASRARNGDVMAVTVWRRSVEPKGTFPEYALPKRDRDFVISKSPCDRWCEKEDSSSQSEKTIATGRTSPAAVKVEAARIPVITVSAASIEPAVPEAKPETPATNYRIGGKLSSAWSRAKNFLCGINSKLRDI